MQDAIRNSKRKNWTDSKENKKSIKMEKLLESQGIFVYYKSESALLFFNAGKKPGDWQAAQ